MGILGILGLVGGIGGVGTALAFFFIPGAGEIITGIAKAVLAFLASALEWALEHWKVVVPVLIAAAAVIYILILRGEVGRRDDKIAAQGTLIEKVRVEVDRGVCNETPKGKKCLPTTASDEPIYVRSFVDNLATVKGALDRQTTALNAAKADAEAHTAAAHEAAKPTPAQEHRADVRQHIVDPKRTSGLTEQEWGQL